MAYTISISCETENAEIRYDYSASADIEADDPTESSTLYSSPLEMTITDAGRQIKARAFKSNMIASDVVTKIIRPVVNPMILPDGSVLFSDRGIGYGNYVIGEDGYPIRLDGAVDDGTAESHNWRFLICDKQDLKGIDNTNKWGINRNEGLTGTTDIGYGLPNTNAMIPDYTDGSTSNNVYWWKFIKQRRDETGFDWFMPSHDELYSLYLNRDDINSVGETIALSGWYWSSTECDTNKAYIMGFPNGEPYDELDKSVSQRCRLIRRI